MSAPPSGRALRAGSKPRRSVSPSSAFTHDFGWVRRPASTPHDRPAPPPDPRLPAVPSPDDVRGVLAGGLDPPRRASIIDLGMVHDVRVEPNGDVVVKVALTTAACPLRGQIGADVRSKLAGLPGVG